VTRKQIEVFFDLSANEKNDKALLEDKSILAKNMNEDGWISVNTLMALKHMVFPGHDLMMETIKGSSILELDEAEQHFRCKDLDKNKLMKETQPTSGTSSTGTK